MKKFLSYPEETRRDIIQDVCVKLKPIYKKISFAVAWNIFQDINPQIEMLVPGLYNIPQLEKIKQELERLCN